MSEVLKWNKSPAAGARLSATDILAIVVCTLFTGWVWPWLDTFALIAPFVLGHFFLFCNIFRIRRSLELIWAGGLLVQTFAWMGIGDSLSFLPIVLTQLPLTCIVIGLEMRSARYHGIFSHKINPRLDEYLERRHQGE